MKKLKITLNDKEVETESFKLEKEEKKITLLTQEFGNGDLNVLRDKINEIIGA